MEIFKIRNLDWQLIGISTLIAILGSISLLSTSITLDGKIDFTSIFLKQVFFILFGIIIFWVTIKIDASYLKYIQVSTLFYIFVLLLLIITLLFGPSINAAKRWIIIAGVQLQPSELAKLAVIFITASIIGLKNDMNLWLKVGITFGLTTIYAILIYLEPHTTMAGLMYVMWFITLFTILPHQFRNLLLILEIGLTILGTFLIIYQLPNLGIPMLIVALLITAFGTFSKFVERHLFLIVLLPSLFIGLIGPLTINAIPQFEHQQKRIEAFLNPSESSQDSYFNVDQARVAIGSGQIFGKGFGNGTQGRLNYLPEHQTDFIFAVYAEEFGLIGSVFLILLYTWLIMRIFNLSLNIHDNFSAVVVLAIGVKILFEVFINIGTNTGIIPATGIPLPLFSAGGTITLVTFFSLGIIQSIISNSQEIIDSEQIIN